jgi:hypothetical protein
MSARAFAVAGLGLVILGALGTVVVRIAAPVPILGTFGFNEITMLGYLIAALTWASVGALLVARRPENTIGWLMVLVGVGSALSQCSVSLTFAFAAEGTTDGDRNAQIAGWATVPLQLIPGVQNPFALGPDLRGGRPIVPILVFATLLVFVSLVISMVTRYRSAGHIERQQMKWFVVSLGISAIGLGVVTTEVVILDRPEETLGLTVYVYAGAVVPVAIGIAILRHGLYDIDRIISRTLAYATITGVLAVVFTGVILLVGSLLTALAHGVIPTDQGRTIAVAISTLVVFALFQPVRRGVQQAIDRRFDRARYDAGRTVEAFTDRLRYDVDLAAVSQEIVVTATAAGRPASATVWLRAGPDVRR